MAIDATYDFGTVQLFESSGVIEATFPFTDAATRNAIKPFKGRWDKVRRAWRIDPHITRCQTGDIVYAIRSALIEAAPPAWRDALPALGGLVTTTRNFEMHAAEGGIRIGLPPGHVHEWTLKNAVTGPDKNGNSWLIPAIFCNDAPIKNIIRDVIKDDMKALAAAIDYLGGFSFTGDLDLTDGELGAIGLVKGSKIFANPSFVRKADPVIGPEPVNEYVFEVAAVDVVDDRTTVTLRVVTGMDAWKALRARYASPMDARSIGLDVRHLKGKWVRRRN